VAGEGQPKVASANDDDGVELWNDLHASDDQVSISKICFMDGY
jgi:hypothetical protein